MFLRLFAILLVGVSSHIAALAEPLRVDWPDLRPNVDFADPFAELSNLQLKQLGQLARIQRLIAEEKIPAKGEDAGEARRIEQELHEANIDVFELMSMRRTVCRLREEAGRQVQPKVVNQQVVIAGFVVPLVRREGVVTQFLLVPAYDFCCRASPPAPNQAIYVKWPEGIDIPGPMAAAQMTGRLTVHQSSWTVQRKDQTATYAATYALDASSGKVYAGLQGQDTQNNLSMLRRKTKP